MDCTWTLRVKETFYEKYYKFILAIRLLLNQLLPYKK